MLRFLRLASSCALLVSIAPATSAQGLSADLFASVNGKSISAIEFDQHARENFRKKFYHGKPPEAEVAAMLRKVGQELIDRELLDAETVAKNIVADPIKVAKDLEKLEQNNKTNAQWQAQRAENLPGLTALIAKRIRHEQLEKQIRQVNPTPAEVEAFYRANPLLFTEPSRNKISLIMIRVDPSSAPAIWEQAKDKILEIKAKIEQGADFAAVAREFSNDPTAPSGGDMGYVHDGMLGGQAEDALQTLLVGELSEPVRTLEGEALFRLDGRQPSALQPFELASARARTLLIEKRSDTQWSDYLTALRARASVVIGPAFKQVMESAPDTPAPPPAR